MIGRDWMHSLRWRLLAAVGIAVLLIWLLAGWFSYTQAQHEAEELMDGSLAQTSRLLLTLLNEDERAVRSLAAHRSAWDDGREDVYEPPLEFQIGSGDGTILVRSANAPALPVLGVLGYIDIERPSGAWRVLNAESSDGRYRVQVSHAVALRDRASLEVAGQTILPLAIIVPVLLLLVYVSVRRGLRPLERLAADAAARSADNLAPLPRDGMPTEAWPLVAALNRLFARLDQSIEHERRFTADAAHELRTPLAALKVQTQVAGLSPDEGMRRHALQQIEAGVDRATHLVEQLLRLARLDPLVSVPNAQSIDPVWLVGEVLGAIGRGQPEIAGRLLIDNRLAEQQVRGDADLLTIALRNLLDNALRYSPADGRVQIELAAGASGIDLAVVDGGPGVAPDDLARLGERFFRGRGTLVEGTGLGLAIVARVAELHGARLQLANLPGGGFRAVLSGLPAA